MMQGASLGLFLHLLSLIVYAGATVTLIAVVIPAARQAETPSACRSFLAAALRIYDPLIIASTGVLVMSGAFNLTAYKDILRGEYFAKVGGLLMWKLGLAFAVIMMATYVTFGLGHRIVRNLALDDPLDPAWLNSMMNRLTYASALSLALIALTAWYGLQLGHPIVVRPQ